jgi:hypothetical protein
MIAASNVTLCSRSQRLGLIDAVTPHLHAKLVRSADLDSFRHGTTSDTVYRANERAKLCQKNTRLVEGGFVTY